MGKIMGIYGIYDDQRGEKLQGILSHSPLYGMPIYVGQSIDIDSRWAQHRKMIKKGSHHNTELQKHINLIGIENISFGVIEVVPQRSSLNDREEYWICQYGRANLCNSSYEKRADQASVQAIMKSCQILESLGMDKIGTVRIEGNRLTAWSKAGVESESFDEVSDMYLEAKRMGFSGEIIQIDNIFAIAYKRKS